MVAYFKDIKKRADELGIEIGQTHGRVSIYGKDERLYPVIDENARRDLLATAALGAPPCIMHSVSTIHHPDETPERMRALNLAFFTKLIPHAEQYGVTVALETFGDAMANGERVIDFFGDVTELKAQYDALPTARKTLCMDTGHTHKAAAVKPSVMDTVDAIRYLGNDITVLHLNDNNGATDQHLPPHYAGKNGGLDWKAVMQALSDVGYSGIYNFELAVPYGSLLEETTRYFAKYLRHFVDGTL